MSKFVLTLSLLCSIATGISQENKNIQDTLIKEINLGEVTVAATRFPESKKNIAQQITIISRKKIGLYNQPTTAELLSQSGEVMVQKSQLGGGSPVIRGFEANKVLLVIDGVRMNNAIYRGGHLQNVITLDNAILEKTEILFGPASVIYGSDALGGVMSFHTRKPQLSTDGNTVYKSNATIRYASAYDEKNIHGDFEIGGKKLASLSSFTFSKFGDLVQGSDYYSDFPDWGKRNFNVAQVDGVDSMISNSNTEKQIPTGYEQYDFLQKLAFNTGRLGHEVNFQYSSTSDIYRYDRLTEVDGAGIAKSAEWYYGPQQRLLAAWNLQLPKTNFYDRSHLIVAWQDIEESRHNRNFNSAKRNHRTEQVSVASLNADFIIKRGPSDLSYGAEIIYNNVKSTAYAENIKTGIKSPLDTRYPDGGSNTQTYAGYVTLLHSFSKIFVLNSGLRFSINSLESKFNDTAFFPFPFKEIQQNNSALTGNIGLVVTPGTGWKISGLISTGFRTPNVDDMSKVFESTPGRLVVPNPDLKPERTVNYEAGISKLINQKVLLGVTGWYTDYSKALTTEEGEINGSSTIIYDGVASDIYTTVNKNKAYIWGMSGRVSADINEHFSFNSILNYTYGRIRENPEDYPLDHVAPLFGKTSLTTRWGKFTGEVFALYNGTKDSADYNLRGEDNQIYSADPEKGFTPSWFTMNIRTALELNKFVSVQFAVENVLDKYYRVFSSGLSAPGRNFVITLKGNFR